MMVIVMCCGSSVEDDSSSNPSSQLRKAKTELQDGFQPSYQPPSLNQLQDGGDNLSILIPFLLLSSQQSFQFLFRHHLHFVVHVPFSNTFQQPVEMQKIIVYHLSSILQVPFSNMSQQPVEMQKTMQKTKVIWQPCGIWLNCALYSGLLNGLVEAGWMFVMFECWRILLKCEYDCICMAKLMT